MTILLALETIPPTPPPIPLPWECEWYKGPIVLLGPKLTLFRAIIKI